jgi:hypothetical protein
VSGSAYEQDNIIQCIIEGGGGGLVKAHLQTGWRRVGCGTTFSSTFMTTQGSSMGDRTVACAVQPPGWSMPPPEEIHDINCMLTPK